MKITKLEEFKNTVNELIDVRDTCTVCFEVETNLDAMKELGGNIFKNIEEAYKELHNILEEQTDAEYFECEDFDKVNSFQFNIIITYEDCNLEDEIIVLAVYKRVSDTDFEEIIK